MTPGDPVAGFFHIFFAIGVVLIAWGLLIAAKRGLAALVRLVANEARRTR